MAKSKIIRKIALASLFISCSLAGPALAQTEYRFVKIVDTSSTFEELDAKPTLNDRGTVAYWTRETGTLTEAIYKGRNNGSRTKIISTTDSNVQDIWGYKSINYGGDVAVMMQYFNNNTTILVNKGGSITHIVQVGSTAFTDFEDPQINDNGLVAFYGEKTGGVNGIYAGDGSSAPSKIKDTTDGASFPGFARYASIGNNGYLGFASSSAAGADNKVIYKGNGTTTTKIAEPDSTFIGVGTADGACAINNLGVVCFMGWGSDTMVSWNGVFTGSGAAPTEIVKAKTDDSTPFSMILSPPAVNDSQQVAFTAMQSDVDSTQGLYTGPNPVTDKVLEEGDILDEKVVSGVTFSRHGLNNRGQMAISVIFTDNSKAIYRADPPGIGCPHCPPMYLLLLGSGV